MNGGRKIKPDAVASGGTMNIVVGIGSSSSKGGPSSSHILAFNTVNVVAGTRVVPAILASGNGGGGIRTPNAEAIGVVVLGSPGKPVVVNGAKSGLKNGEVENGEKGANGRNGNVEKPGAGDQNGLKNGEINCACAPILKIRTKQNTPKTRKKAAFL